MEQGLWNFREEGGKKRIKKTWEKAFREGCLQDKLKNQAACSKLNYARDAHQ